MRIEEEKLSEKIVYAAFKEFNELVAQAKDNPIVGYNLRTPIINNEKYKYFTDDMLKNATPIQIIKGSIETPNIKAYFFQNSKGLYTGFLAISEGGYRIINDIKVLSFGYDNSDDENLIFKDLPLFLAQLCKEYKSISWTGLKGNRANAAYKIAYKRLGGKGEPEVKGDRIIYHIER